MGTVDAWTESCHIAITDTSNSIIKLEALTETVDIDEGEKDMEGTPILNGGRVIKFTPEGDTTVTLEAYPTEAGTMAWAATPDGKGFWDLKDTVDSIEPISIAADHTRTRYRLAVLWTDDTTVTSAQDSTTATAYAMRWSGANGYITAVKPSFTDGILKFSVTFKVTPFNKAATANITRESTKHGTALPSLVAFS